MADVRMQCKVKPDDRVACSQCGTSVSVRNLSRHRKIVHGAISQPTRGPILPDNNLVCRAVSVADPLETRSRSTSRDVRESTTGVVIPRRLSTSSDGGDMGDATITSTFLAEVACAILEQHHQFTEAELMTYVGDFYPEVPPSARRALIVGAVTGAQQAARLQFLMEKNKASPDPAKRAMAANAGSSLSFWNMGLRCARRSNPAISSKQSSVSGDVELTHHLSTEELVESQDGTVARSIIGELQFPVSFEQSNVQFDQPRTFDVVVELQPDEVFQQLAQNTESPTLHSWSIQGAVDGLMDEQTVGSHVQRQPDDVHPMFVESTAPAERGPPSSAQIAAASTPTIDHAETNSQPIEREEPMTSKESGEKPNEHVLVRSLKAAVNISEEDMAKANEACLSTSRKSLKKTSEPMRNATPPPIAAPAEEHFVIDINLQQDTEMVEPQSSSGASRQPGVAEDKGKKKASAQSDRESHGKEVVPAKQTDDGKASERGSLTDRRADKGYRIQNRDGRDKLEGEARSQRKDDARRTRSRSSSPRRTGKKTHYSPERVVLTGRELEQYRRYLKQHK